MSFREKSAWITLVTVLGAFGLYFGAITAGLVSARGFDTLHLLLACVVGLVLLQVVLTLIAAVTTPKDGRAPNDERETLIQLRAQSLGYSVLVMLVLGLFIPGHLGHTVIDMMNFALLDVVLAVLTVAVAQIVMFRRGA